MNPLALVGDIFNIVFLGPIVNLLVLIYRGLSAVHFPGALGFSIIILTVFIRILIWPFISSQLRSTRKMALLKPKLDDLQKKHSGDKQALAAAQMALYKEHGVNPAGGCLPSLIQLPTVIALYQTILAAFNGHEGLNRINAFLYVPGWKLQSSPDLHFLGLNLADKPSQHALSALILIPLI